MTRYLWTASRGLTEHRPWPTWIAIGATCLALGAIGDHVLTNYQTGVAVENLRTQTERILLAAERHELPRERVVTRAQAAVTTDRIDKERRSQ
jgi:hypothetical protein